MLQQGSLSVPEVVWGTFASFFVSIALSLPKKLSPINTIHNSDKCFN
ncbi:unnamed protein product [Rodentolepis nana]|uniref:Uncharacterized protein n=1 Tax=Rodentolepis nana TaxID=102285 RepID=A0A0R3TLD5_RODNA|nr:unnamed protein product [Rodentolepis nana]